MRKEYFYSIQNFKSFYFSRFDFIKCIKVIISFFSESLKFSEFKIYLSKSSFGAISFCLFKK